MYGIGFGGLGIEAWGLWFYGRGFRVWVLGSEFRVHGLGFRV